MNYGLGAYKKTSINTARKEEILLMLYEAAVKFCKKGIEAIENKDIAKKGECIGKLQDIVMELNNSLDHKVGGKIADELSSLYDYIFYSSTQANINMDTKPLQDSLKVLITLQEGWVEAVKSIKKVI
ncbi:MAG: flagellar export chaperone FliS [Epsilonproteobacteria bacterium]|nr:MAG: flagellar export chaperone FliS [Campylobacterota bacterium]RLA66815.1 MAG: flagellar export chaperone FliS [Campylobacterota bacterium]